MKAKIPILAFLFLALVFSCKSSAQSVIPDVVPQVETLMSQSQEIEEIVRLVNTTDTVEEIPLNYDTDEEENEEELEETPEEIEQPESIEIVEVEEIPEIQEIEETPIQEEAQESEEQRSVVEAIEENMPLPQAESTPPVEQPPVAQPPVTHSLPVQQPPVTQPPPVQQPPAQQAPTQQPSVQQPPAQQAPAQQPSVQQLPAQQAPAQQPSVQQPPAQSQVPERTAPRPPPSPPPFLGPAEPERAPPAPQETFTPTIPELPSIPRDEKPTEQVVFSRVVRLTVGQMLEIPFRGTGWVYLGELGNRRGITYDSSRRDIERGNILGQSFVFRAENPGTYILKFYKQDFIYDYIINDYVQVIVGEADDSGRGRPVSAIDRGRVVAEPRWPSILEAAGSTNETVSQATAPAAGASAATTAGAATGTASGTQRPDAVMPSATPQAGVSPVTESTLPETPAERARASEVSSPEEYVRQAKQEFDAGRVTQALDILELLKQHYPSGTDEAWWLLGQLYESNSSARDIRLSLEYYRRLVNEYPQSNRVDDARRRIAYLERYYLNIR